MILRRIADALRKQDWFTVVIEILIVVIGIFLGLQVTEWNQNRKDKVLYEQAITRLQTEVTGNISIVESEIRSINTALAEARAGLDALVTCDTGENAVIIVNAAIARARGTQGIEVQSASLLELTSNSILLAQQSNATRIRFAETLYYINLTRGLSQRFEAELGSWPANSPTIAIGAPETLSGVYFGINYEVPRYPMVLNVPMTEACKDKALQKWLLQWEAWQTNVGIFNEKLHQEFGATLALIKGLKP